MSKQAQSIFIRNFVFGVEDSLVSTVGLLAGVAVADVERQTILLTGGVLIAVEALSMGVGSLLSESFAEEYVERSTGTDGRSLAGAIIMFVSYALAGFIPLLPYALLGREYAFTTSITASCVALFLLGFVGSRYFGANGLKTGLRMLLLGGGAIAVGVLVGRLLHVSL
ncbi:VIT1/CCC1 transporter family protein [Candidatus Uhrbacteria bacterium]|nr:VIT1/CCC1 transporter family protein [Candidatus Uhrbacteria bacterium]